MSIVLPLDPGPVSAEPYFIDAGGWQEPVTTGDPVRVDMLGDRFGLKVTMPPMEEEAALVWIKALIKGRKEGVTFEFPANYRLPVLNRSTAAINAANLSQANSIPLKNMAGLTLEDGRFISIERSGKNYLHQVDGEQVIAGSTHTVPIIPRTRKAFAANDAVELDRPKIDGVLQGDEQSWTVSTAIHYGLEFQIKERQ